MKYQIQITKAAERDLAEATDYIEFVLKNPDAAGRLVDVAESKIKLLESNPRLYPLVEDAVLKARGIRFINVSNYIAFYAIDEKQQCVYVIRFLLCRRNWTGILRSL